MNQKLLNYQLMYFEIEFIIELGKRYVIEEVDCLNDLGLMIIKNCSYKWIWKRIICDKLLLFKYSLLYSTFVILSTSLLDIHIHYLLNRYKTNYHYNQKTICSWLCHIICIVHKMLIIQKNLSNESNEQLRVLFWFFSLFITITLLYSDYSIQFKKKIVNKILNLLNNNHLD